MPSTKSVVSMLSTVHLNDSQCVVLCEEKWALLCAQKCVCLIRAKHSSICMYIYRMFHSEVIKCEELLQYYPKIIQKFIYSPTNYNYVTRTIGINFAIDCFAY